jgi:hypothetical protein
MVGMFFEFAIELNNTGNPRSLAGPYLWRPALAYHSTRVFSTAALNKAAGEQGRVIMPYICITSPPIDWRIQ